METTEKISLLSKLPASDITDFLLFASHCSNITDRAKEWADILNKSLEEKQANILKEYDEIDPAFV